MAVGVVPLRIRCPRKNATKETILADDQRHDPEHRDFGHQDQRAPRLCRDRRSDAASGVLRSDEEYAQHADGQLGEKETGEAGAGRIKGRPGDQ